MPTAEEWAVQAQASAIAASSAASGLAATLALVDDRKEAVVNMADSVESSALLATTQASTATAQAALAIGAATNLQAEAIGARQGGTVADTGKQVLSLVGIDGGTSNLTATFARWARFRDAGSVDDETTIKTGSIVSGIALTAVVLATAAKARGRVWRRPLSSGSLNAAPGSAPDDVLLRDTGIVAIADDLLTMVGLSQIYLNIPVTKFEVLAGYAYGFDFEIYDASNTLLTATARYTTTAALAQRHAGFYYATTGAGSFTAQTTTRPIRMGYSTPSITSNLTDLEKKAERKLAATANSSKLTDLERLAISRQGAWSGPNKIIRPNYPSYRHGLARLGLTDGAYGVDYGPRIALADMTEMTAVTGVNLGSSGQIRFESGSANSPKGAVYSGLKQVGSRGIYQPTANWARLFLTDCYMNGQTTVGKPVDIQQVGDSGVTKFPYVELEYCDFRYFSAGMGNLYNGAIRKSLILHSGANTLQIQQEYDNGCALILEQNLFMFASTIEAGAISSSHGDVLEMNMARNASCVGNVYYMPSTGTTYDPGSYGSTNCIRHSAQSSAPISNVYHLGELIVGGNSPVGMNMRGGTILNMLFAFNKYGGTEYSSVNSYIAMTGPQTGDTGITTDWCNLAFFDEYRVDGTPMPIGGGTPGTVNNAVPATYYARPANAYRTNEEKWGIFNWDKARATPKFIEALQLLGLATGRTILDSNNDLNAEYALGALKATL
ncbi:hypothetical protein Saro_0664 [Novosphingobium aromaticivorans DSM 12444]|uniref:Uncharacterized protein n=1 Tax=Novosphingobium aromaticivorans (strain ATCC 700278 / DSM 12444 / CCUG 56034 / CIP 105152 / NBRC 16084 / F199) TaxID=279238 RepID=Q2GAL2_NOVAD|nr:hypothetical protein [Novosphingobium aromaticivorans]ABD25111.1 hypothetical protein Saro_0664 [Novosphingobium aromaticivorans DSM 12444]SCY95707.1 hypothetical protein SAMN05660666_03872 [Novosphingobium aromaticivorans]